MTAGRAIIPTTRPATMTTMVGANQSCTVIRSRTEAKVSPGAVKVRIMRPAMPAPESSFVGPAMTISSVRGVNAIYRGPGGRASGPRPPADLSASYPGAGPCFGTILAEPKGPIRVPRGHIGPMST